MMKAGTLLACGNAGFAGYDVRRPHHPRHLANGSARTCRPARSTSAARCRASARTRSFVEPSAEADIASVRLPRQIRHRFPGTFKKIVNAGNSLRYGVNELISRPLPHTVFSEADTYWNAKVVEDISPR